ncbi:MAG TPA: ABC transporter permease subunit [Acidimicrobiales bacterium]|nr:ABC transporter permease subunit [Acidimicrobiales bacterium]
MAQVRVTGRRVVRSEWIKLRTLRSSWLAIGMAVAGMVGIGLLVCWSTNARWDHMDPIERLTFDPVFRSLVGIEIAQLVIGVLGVLVITGEYGTGMIRSSLAAVPARLPVLWGKLLVYGAVVLVWAMVASFASFYGGQALLGVHGTTIDGPGVLRAVIGAGLYLAVVALFAVGLGFVVRNTAGGIAVLFALLLVLPGIVHALPSSWQHHVLPYLPSQAGGSVFSLRRDADTLSPWTGFGVFVAWAAAAVAAGAAMLVRRDA